MYLILILICYGFLAFTWIYLIVSILGFVLR